MKLLKAKIIINTSKEQLWQTLLDKVYQPANYIPGVESFELQERETNEIIRTLYTEIDEVVELITIRPDVFEIESTLVKHSFMKGKLLQRIEETEEGLQLSFEQERTITLDELKGLDMQPALEAALLQIKEKVEKEAS